MTSLQRQKIVYDALCKVYREGAYSQIQLDEVLSNEELTKEDKASITAMFYGVIEKDTALTYFINELCDKKPKPAIAVLLKMGIYGVRYSSSPLYAVIDNTVTLCKDIGKKEVSGFVNAVLRKSEKCPMPDKSNKTLYLSVLASVPEWLAKAMIKDYGEERATAILTAKLLTDTHIRLNYDKITDEEFEKKVTTFTKSKYGYYVKPEVFKKLKPDEFTPMSLASMIATQCYRSLIKDGAKVLDTCSAPGGKAVYLSSLGNFDITACDVHSHRVELIGKYAKRMGANLSVVQNDATVLKEDWLDGFDAVICDTPCSGIGVISSKPDVLLNRKEEDIAELAKLQLKILNTSAKYLKKDGTLFYSTCTVLRRENDNVVKNFIASNPDFEVVKTEVDGVNCDKRNYVRLLPDVDGTDGFFVVALKRKQ
ncbi:MAG: 16S rRNA (cytosine(967)-C(5))-methyltransferase RsmB [Clostridia bacterium]|nr:16S rRNA (cytosine(967)-C(5))-methyltransferase RsmB [Clostridia bacterium]